MSNTEDIDFGFSPAVAFAEYEKKARRAAGANTSDLGLPFRDWIRGEFIVKANPDGEEGDTIDVPNNRVYYFFSNPEVRADAAKLVNGRQTWLAADEVAVNNRWNAWIGTDEKMPWALSNVPIRPAKRLNEDNKIVTDYSNRDPILSLMKPLGKDAEERKNVRPAEHYFVACVMLEKPFGPNADPQDKSEWVYTDSLLSMNKSDYIAFCKMIQVIADTIGDDFDLTGMPVKLWREREKGLQVRLDLKHSPKMPDICEQHDPIPLQAYLKDLRKEIEAWLANKGITYNTGSPVEQMNAAVEAIADAGIADAGIADAGMAQMPWDDSATTEASELMTELSSKSDDELKALAKTLDLPLGRFSRHAAIKKIAARQSAGF